MENDSYKNVTHHNMQSKRDGTDQDPDYNEAAPPDRKRLRHLEENGEPLILHIDDVIGTLF
jgi:hypothetical protein